jgi:uncharacterized protein YjiK
MTLRRFFIVALLLILALVVYFKRLDARALLWIAEFSTSTDDREDSLWLPDYSAVLQIAIPGLEKEQFSGLAYNPAADTLLVVSGKTPLLIELSLEGKVLRSIPVFGAANMEAVTVMDDGLIAVTDERQQRLYIFRLLPETMELRIDQALQSFDLGVSEHANKGFEGLVWDRANQRFLLGEERNPVMLYSLPSDGRKVTGELQVLADLGGIMTDLADLAVDPRSGNVLALSQQSHLLVELDQKYQPSNFISLLRGLGGLQHYIPQAEGVALDAAGNLYIVSENNLFYVFKKLPAAQ